ncbi:MAG: dNTP triphosphohydrolase [bacterium]|jgi:dGTPase
MEVTQKPDASLLRLRAQLESAERAGLAPFAMKSGDTAGREHEEPPPRHRTHFQRDWHRITHCQAFRKLEFKTQVFTFGEGYETARNRLTHTLEVSQITTSICRALGLNEDLGTAIALAHDLGHPPFGHAGEDILHELVRSFNHNVHGLRIVRQLEMRYPDFPGLNLTLETLEGLEKHDTEYDKIAHHEFLPGKMPTLEAQAASVADSIAYRSHDLEDGLSSGIFGENTLDASGLEIWKMLKERLANTEGEVRMAQLSRHLIDIMVADVLAESSSRIRAAGADSVDVVRAYPGVLIAFSNEIKSADAELGKFLYEHFYSNYRVLRLTNKGKTILRKMFETFASTPQLLPPNVYLRYREAGEKRNEEPLRVIADYLAGLTDRQATDEYVRLFDVGAKWQ